MTAKDAFAYAYDCGYRRGQYDGAEAFRARLIRALEFAGHTDAASALRALSLPGDPPPVQPCERTPCPG
jgi:hypothetical protein